MKKALIITCTMLSFNAMAQKDAAISKNLLSATPVYITATNPRGFGITYERMLGNSGKFSFVLPVSYSYGNSNPCDPTIKTRMLRAYPGIRFYPAGSSHIVSYAMGATAIIGKGSSNCQCGLDVPQTEVMGAVTETQVVKDKPFTSMTEAGLMFDNSINMQATKHVFIGSDLGIGASLIDHNNNTRPGLAFRFTFNVGYRF